MSFIHEGTQLSVSLTFETIICYKCGMPFAVPSKVRQELLRNQNTFYCPSGHNQAYIGETEEQRLRKLVDAKNAEISRKLTENIQLEGQINTLQRKLKRVHNGTCPCCKRSFKDLASHMKTKHPELLKKP